MQLHNYTLRGLTWHNSGGGGAVNWGYPPGTLSSNVCIYADFHKGVFGVDLLEI